MNGLFLYVGFALLIASPKHFRFRDGVEIPVYIGTDPEVKRSIRQQMVELEKKISGMVVSKDEKHMTIYKPKVTLKMRFREKVMEVKHLIRPVPNFKTAREWKGYIRRRVMEILDKYFNLDESDFRVTMEGRVKLVGKKRIKAADWVYKKYGILNPRPTFTRIKTPFGEIYRVECPPEWKPDVLFLRIHFGVVRVPLRIPLFQRVGRAMMERAVSVMPIMTVLMGKDSPMFGFFKHEDFTEIVNAKDEGIAGDGVTDDTDNLETFFTDYAGRCTFFPRGTYNVDWYDARVAGGYSDHMGPAILSDTTIVGEGDGTNFVALADALFMFYIVGTEGNITFKDCKFTGTGISGAGSLSSSSIWCGNVDNLHLIKCTSVAFKGQGGGMNDRGFSIVGTHTGSLLQDCRMDDNQHGIVIGAPSATHGLRILSCYSNDAVEKNLYFEGQADGFVMMSTVADGTGSGCYAYYGYTPHGGSSFTGNIFISDGAGMSPYQPGSYTTVNCTWNNNIAMTGSGNAGCYPMCAFHTFVGNVIAFNATTGFYAFTNFEHNLVKGNVVAFNGSTGMYLQNESHYNTISNNLIVNNSGGTGLFMRSGNYNKFIDNTIYSSDTGTYHYNYGLRIDTQPIETRLRGNDFTSAGDTPVSDGSTTTIWEGNNIGYLGPGEFRMFRTRINYDDASPVEICDVDDGYAITEVWVNVITTFDDGGATVDIGDGADPNGFLPTANINLGVAGYYGLEADERGDYLWDAGNTHVRQKVYTGVDTVDAVIVKTNGTQGVADVYVKVVRIGS